MLRRRLPARWRPRMIEPMQLAALLLEKTTECLSEEEVGEVVRPRRRASR